MGNSQGRQLFEDAAEGEGTTISVGEQLTEGPESPVAPTQDEMPETPQPPHRSRHQGSQTSTQPQIQQVRPRICLQDQEAPVENSAPAAPPPTLSAQASEQEAPATPTNSEQRRRNYGRGPLYARRGSHRGFPGRSTPRADNPGAYARSGAGGPGGGPPGDSSAGSGSPGEESSDSSIESIYSETTEPDDNEDDLTPPGFFLCITGEVRFCTRLNGEGEPLRQGWQVANFLSERGRAHGLRRGLRNVHRVEENREVALLPASTVLTRIANSRRGRPFEYADHYSNVPYLNVMWAYHINLDEQVLAVYGPPSRRRHEVPDEDFFHDANEFGPHPGRYPRPIFEYTFDQLLEFDSPQSFHISVYDSFSQEARARYGLLGLGYVPNQFNPTEFDDAHQDPRSPSVTTAPTEVHVILRSPPGSDSPPDEDGDQPRLESPIRFVDEGLRRRSPLHRTPTPGPAHEPLLYPHPENGMTEERRPPGPRSPPLPQPPPPAHLFRPARPSSGPSSLPSPGEGNSYIRDTDDSSPSPLPPIRQTRPIHHAPPMPLSQWRPDHANRQHSPENRPTYNRHGSPWEPGDTPPPGDDPSLDYGQRWAGPDDSTEIEEDIRQSSEDRGTPRILEAHMEPSSPASGVILRLPTDENSSPVRGQPQWDQPRTPPPYMWRRPPYHPSSSSSPIDVSREPHGNDDGSPTFHVQAARRSEERQRSLIPELPPLRRSPLARPNAIPGKLVEPGVSDSGSDIYDSSPIGTQQGSKRSCEEQDPSSTSYDETGEPIFRCPPVKKRRRYDESNSAGSGGQAEPDAPGSESSLPDYESDPKTPSPSGKRPRDSLTSDDNPPMESDTESTDPSAKRQCLDMVGDSSRSAGGAYPSHLRPPRTRTSIEQVTLDFEEVQREFNDQVIPVLARENEQIIFRSPQWGTPSSRGTSDEESPKSMQKSAESFSPNPEYLRKRWKEAEKPSSRR